MSDNLSDLAKLRENPSLFVDEILDIEPFDYQAEFMDAPGNRKAFVSGRQVGKSRTASWMALHYAVTHPDSLVLVTADALRQSSELFSQIRSEMDNSGLPDDVWGVKRDTQTTVEFDHGSRIKVVPTGRNGNKIRGYTADFVIVDEAAFVDDAIFEDVIEPMTFVTDGTIVLCSTPYGTSGYFYRKATDLENWQTTWDPQTGGVASYDNPKIDDQDIEDYKEGKTEDQIAREVDARFVEGGNAFFPPEIITKSMHTSVGKESDEVYMGVDPSGGGDAESVMSCVDRKGNVFKIESHTGKTPDLRRRIETLHNHYDFETILVDRGGVGENFVEELSESIGRRVVDDVYLTLQTKQDIYQTFKARMEANTLDNPSSPTVALPHNQKLKTQMEGLGFSRTSNGNIRIQPRDSDMNDDHPDAVAISVYALPDNAGSGSKGAGGMTRAMTIGKLTGDGQNKSYQFGADEDEHDDLNRSDVGSSYIR